MSSWKVKTTKTAFFHSYINKHTDSHFPCVNGVYRNNAGLLACSNNKNVIKPAKQGSNLEQIVKQLLWASQTDSRHGGTLLSQWVFNSDSDNLNSGKFISHSLFAKISIKFRMCVRFYRNDFPVITFKKYIYKWRLYSTSWIRFVD